MTNTNTNTKASMSAASAGAAGRRGSKAKKTLIMEGPNAVGVTFHFADGTTESRRVSDYPAHVQAWCAAFGLSQTLGDAYSGAKTVAEAIGLFAKRDDTLKSGNLTARRGPAGPNWQHVALAYCTVKGIDPSRVDAVRERILAMPDDTRAAVVKHPAIAAEVTRLELAALEDAAAEANDTLPDF